MRAGSSRRAALYLRVSTREQRPDLQLDQLRDLAERRGWQVVGEFIDHGESGGKDSRPQLDALMQLVHRAKLDVVCCWKFDRFARSVRHLIVTLEDLNARGIDFVSVQDAIDTSTPTGRFTFHVIAAVAELEREMIRDRTRAGLAAARRRGKRLGRPPTHVNVCEALRLRQQGLSVRQVAARLGKSYGVVQRSLRDAEADDGDGGSETSSDDGG
ncbi:MAG: recombinase family protein [Polyangiaceae bacterium]|nr:recombinase family protein [Polyangiaceae bacterium]